MSIFLSYAPENIEFADVLYRLLQSKGYEVWIDRREIAGGIHADAMSYGAIDIRTHVIVILSPESVDSTTVTDEWHYALDDKSVIPLYYRECTIPKRLRGLQRIDFVKQDFATAFSNLLETLGPPDMQPGDRIELAKRDGMIFVEMVNAMIRVAFVYSDYPRVDSFLRTVWYCLLWSVIQRDSTGDPFYEYGVRWVLKNKTTGKPYKLPKDRKKLMLHEIGLEPNVELEVVLL